MQRQVDNKIELIKEIGSNLDNEWEKFDYKKSLFPELVAVA